MSRRHQAYVLKDTDVADGYPQKQKNKTFRLGEIVHHVESMNEFLVLVKDALPEVDTDHWLLPRESLYPVDIALEEYLLPVHPSADRLELLRNSELCQALKDLAKDDIVFVLPDSSHIHNLTDKPAIVKYKGPIPEIESAGILFGVELLNPKDGDVNPDFAGHSGFKNYFTCEPLSGLIKTANEILPYSYVDKSQKFKGEIRLPFKVANTVEFQRAKFDSMPQSSYVSSRSVDHSNYFDEDRHTKPAASTASCVSKSPEEFHCIGRQMPVSQRPTMDRTSSQPSRPDKLLISKRRDEYNDSSEYRNGYTSSPFNGGQRYLSSDQLYTKDSKSSLFGEMPNSHSSSNFSHSSKTTPMNKSNGVATQLSSSDTVDGCKMRNISKPIGINNCRDKQYSTTYRDDFCTHKSSKVNNTSASGTLHSPGYSSNLHSVHSDPNLNHLSKERNERGHNVFPRDPDFSGTSPESLEFEVGSVVEVEYNGKPRFGVIRWIGERERGSRKLFVGIETETEVEPEVRASDGSFSGTQYFKCHPRKGIFVSLNKCQKDRRFEENNAASEAVSKTFGYADCPKIEGFVRPMMVFSRDLHKICGKPKGIQGHHNSCYLDATLFSMFTFTSVFDSLLYRPREAKDTPQYNEVQRVLRDEIVNPLRKNMFVRADKVMKLRTLLERHSSVSGLTSEEKDPEEFLNSLVAQMLRAEPFLQLSSGQEAYYYQLFVEKDEKLEMPSVQNLFEQSFLASDIKLKEVPSCLIIQMPRFGKSFKMYPRILPSQLLDVTDVIEDSPRQCHICGKFATFECKACLKGDLESVSYCEGCLDTAHSHPECRTRHHECKELLIPYLFEECPDTYIPRLYMELFAVVCIETSHYVTFVKCGDGPDAPWCFFDSMADRSGEQNGFNIPEVTAVPEVATWLSDEGARKLRHFRDKELPEHAKRLLCDAYMCMYRSPDIEMYR